MNEELNLEPIEQALETSDRTLSHFVPELVAEVKRLRAVTNMEWTKETPTTCGLYRLKDVYRTRDYVVELDDEDGDIDFTVFALHSDPDVDNLTVAELIVPSYQDVERGMLERWLWLGPLP